MFRDTFHVVDKVTGEEFCSFPVDDGLLHLTYDKDKNKILNKDHTCTISTFYKKTILVDFDYKSKNLCQNIEVDLYVLLVNSEGKVLKGITPFTNLKEQPPEIKNGLECIDDETGEDKGLVKIYFDKLPSDVNRIIFIGNVYKSDFSMITNSSMVLYDQSIFESYNNSFIEFNMETEKTNSQCKIIASIDKCNGSNFDFKFKPIDKNLNISDIKDIFKMSFI